MHTYIHEYLHIYNWFVYVYMCMGVGEWLPPRAQKRNYPLETGPLVVQVSVLRTLLHQCTGSCCERICSASVNFLFFIFCIVLLLFSEYFWRLFQPICPFHDGWFMSAPAVSMLSAQQFLTKTIVTPVLHPFYSPDTPPSDFFCFPIWKKSPQRETFLLMWKKWNKKNGRSTKRH